MSLKDYRTYKEMSQHELANKAGISWSSVQRYESGERIPDVNTAARLGEILDIPNDELLKMFGETTV